MKGSATTLIAPVHERVSTRKPSISRHHQKLAKQVISIFLFIHFLYTRSHLEAAGGMVADRNTHPSTRENNYKHACIKAQSLHTYPANVYTREECSQ